MPFSTHITIAFGDTDPAGFVYYPNLLHYCHIAMERFLGEACGIPYHLMLEERRLGFPTVKIETEFLGPLVYGDELRIHVAVLRLGRSSVTLEYRLCRSRDGSECARATMVHVAMDLDSRKAIDLPTDLRSMLEANLI